MHFLWILRDIILYEAFKASEATNEAPRNTGDGGHEGEVVVCLLSLVRHLVRQGVHLGRVNSHRCDDRSIVIVS